MVMFFFSTSLLILLLLFLLLYYHLIFVLLDVSSSLSLLPLQTIFVICERLKLIFLRNCVWYCLFWGLNWFLICEHFIYVSSIVGTLDDRLIRRWNLASPERDPIDITEERMTHYI